MLYGKSQMESTNYILHIDMDAFFASVEQLDNPELKDKPIIVGGTVEQRGVVAAASYEVRKYGIHSAMPTSQALKLCPNLIILPVRMSRYSEISKQINKIFYDYTPEIEPLSLDEAFLINGGVKLYHLAEQKRTTHSLYSRDRPGCQYSILTSSFLPSC
jgi:nucleotidyltransferase/DNA polymerase involved in DNA repair